MEGATRYRTQGGQVFDLMGPRRAGVLWVVLHGFLERRRFPGQCALHLDGEAVAYPLAPWWRWTNWSRWHAADVAEVAEMAYQLVRADFIVLGGHSDGTSPIHEAADICEAGCLVHWSGLWPRQYVASCPGIFLAGDLDKYPTKQRSIEAATAYNTHLQLVSGAGHPWQRSQNRQLIDDAYRLLGAA